MGHVGKAWNVIVEGAYQHPPAPSWNCYTPMSGGQMALNSLIMDLYMLLAHMCRRHLGQ